jgi:hypothetical protein
LRFLAFRFWSCPAYCGCAGGTTKAIAEKCNLRWQGVLSPIAQWLAAFQEVALQNPKLDDALRDSLSIKQIYVTF